MDSPEKDLILEVIEKDAQLRRLYEEHVRLENMLQEYGSRNFLTADEQMEEQALKRRKLWGKDKMMRIISNYSPAA